MAKTTLKIVERKTTVPRESFRKAFEVVFGKEDKSTSHTPKSTLLGRTNTKKKP